MRVNPMTYQQAVRILMMSPFYFKLDLKARKTLVKEFLNIHNGMHKAAA